MFCVQQIATGINTPGSHAEYMVAYADATILLPNGISYEQAASSILRRLHCLEWFKICRSKTSREDCSIRNWRFRALSNSVLQGPPVFTPLV